MKGLYLYGICLCFSKKTERLLQVNGVKGERVFCIPYKDITAIVESVFLKEFKSKEIKRKAMEDMQWIKEKALLHQAVLDAVMSKFSGPIIPMKFGTIFKTKQGLIHSLKENYSKFKNSLENLKSKQEWSLKVYLNRKIFQEELKKHSLAAQKKEKEIQRLSEGIAYFRQKQIDDLVSKEVDKVLPSYIESFFEILKKQAEQGIKGKILEKELTGKTLPMVLNGIFLISEKKVEDFVKEIDKLNKEYMSKGFEFEHSGPWPAYNFVAS